MFFRDESSTFQIAYCHTQQQCVGAGFSASLSAAVARPLNGCVISISLVTNHESLLIACWPIHVSSMEKYPFRDLFCFVFDHPSF